MTTTAYLSKGQYRSAKSRLTRALNSRDPHKVIATVDATFTEWDDGDYAYPDDWHRWNMARSDAQMSLAYGTQMR